MRKQFKNIFLIIFVLGSFFVMNYKVQTVQGAAKDANISGKYPMGASSDFLLAAGNRFRHIGYAKVNGRFMANSMNFHEYTYDSGLLNTDNTNGYLDQLWNPTVIVNDLTAESKIDDPDFPDADHKTSINNLINSLNNMYKSSKFVTDTPKSDVEAIVGKSDKLDNVWNNKFDTLEDGKTHHTLADLTQFKANNVTKYQFENSKPGRSYQQDIADVSDFYEKLTPGTNESNEFWSSDNSIVNDLYDGKSNPTYYSDWNQVVDIVINITSKNDVTNETALKDSQENDRPDAEAGKKAVVAADIDWNKIKKLDPNVQAINVVLNYSPYFYKDGDQKGQLDLTKIPYLVLNYHGFKDRKFAWTANDAFKVGSNALHRFSETTDMYEALGAKDKFDWSNPNVLNFGARVLNNFNDSYDLDNPDDSYDQTKQNMSGLTPKTAAVDFDNLSQMWFGSMLIPHGSFYAGAASGGLYIGGIVAANNITLNTAQLSPGHGDGIFGNNPGSKDDDFPNLSDEINGKDETTKQPKISEISLSTNSGEPKSVNESGGQINFDYATDSLKALPNSGVNASIHVNDAPKEYGLYYRVLKSSDDNSSDWNRVGEGVKSTSDISISDIEASLDGKTNFLTGSKGDKLEKYSANHMGYKVNRKNIIEFGISKTADKKTVSAKDFSALSTFKFTLSIDGTLEVIVPSNLNMGNESLGIQQEFKKRIQVNETSAAFKNVANQEVDGDPTVVIYNPMEINFMLCLNYLRADSDDPFYRADNPFYRPNNFEYSLSGNEYLAMVNNSGELIPVMSREARTDYNSTFLPVEPLSDPKYIYFDMPYSDSYKVGYYESALIWQLGAD